MKKNAIIIGGTSGIGQNVAEILLNKEFNVGITGRRINRLKAIKDASGNQIKTLEHDVTDIESSHDQLTSFFQLFKSIDLVIVSSGISELNRELDWEVEHQVIQTNVNGIANVYQIVFSYFKQQGYGHLVGISSIASIRGNRHCASYSASKAFQANYLEALRCISKYDKLSINVTDVQPGFVDTPMAKGDGLFWVSTVEKAANQIVIGILKNKRKIYVTKRWRLIAWTMRHLPSWILEKL